MTKIVALCALVFVVGCGAGGPPITPKYSTKHTVGYNSKTGVFNRNVISVEFSR